MRNRIWTLAILTVCAAALVVPGTCGAQSVAALNQRIEVFGSFGAWSDVVGQVSGPAAGISVAVAPRVRVAFEVNHERKQTDWFGIEEPTLALGSISQSLGERRVQPYVAAGAGMIWRRHRTKYQAIGVPVTYDNYWNDRRFTGHVGGGMRIGAGSHVSIAADVKALVGPQWVFKTSVAVGYCW